MLDFSGKKVLVVGGSSGIGNGIAQAFRARGAAVTVWGTRASTADYDGVEGSDLSGLTYAKVDASNRELFNDAVGNYGADESNTELRERLAQRKAEAGMADRDDVRCFVDFIDADEGRL